MRPRDLLLEVAEGLLEPLIKCAAVVFERALPALGRIGQEVLRIVEQEHVQRFEPQALERARQLILQPLRVDAVPQTLAVFDHLGEWLAERFARRRELVVLPLHVAGLGHDHDLAARQLALVDQARYHLAHQPLTATVCIVGRGIDQVDARTQRGLEGESMLGVHVVDAVAAKADAAHDQARISERIAGFRREALGAALRPNRCCASSKRAARDALHGLAGACCFNAPSSSLGSTSGAAQVKF